MAKVIAPFEFTDFQIDANRNMTVRFSLQDQDGNWLSPPFTRGYFAIAPYGGQPFIFDKTDAGSNVRFTNLPLGSAQWYLDADFLPTDTVSLPLGVYIYETRLDFSGGQYEVRRGQFLLRGTFI